MERRSRRIPIAVAGLVALFGGLCLHYTTAEGIEHHREWAHAHDMPEPSYAIFWLGLGLVLAVLGVGLAGLLLGKGSSSRE